MSNSISPIKNSLLKSQMENINKKSSVVENSEEPTYSMTYAES
jgi:hypothetical protein